MNTKRQTIWLVSMLSLMVVLSAYYLFTEDVDKLNTATDKATQESIKVTTEVKEPKAADQAVSGGLASSTSTGTSTSAGTEETKAAQTGTTGKQSGAETGSTGKKTDAQVLETAQSSGKSGADYFAEQGLKRNRELAKLTEQYFNITADPKKSDDEIAKATSELEKLQDKQAKIDNLEELLGKNYPNAIVLEDGSKFKAVVQASKLDAKQAQTIIDLMIKELNVTKDAVSVQYMN